MTDFEKVVWPNFVVHQGGGTSITQTNTGELMVSWRGTVVYENGRIKKFKTEDDARAYLARCDAAGRIIHERA